MKQADIIVIGGGLIGVTAAYELASRGQQVALLEARDGVALETSYANGGLLTPSMADPWNAPGVHWQLAASLFDSRSAMKLRLSAVPSLLSWGVRFLRHSSVQHHRRATEANCRLAGYSVRVTREWREHLDLQYDVGTAGSMKLFRDCAAMEHSIAVSARLEPNGLRYRQLDGDQAVEMEPQLAPIRGDIAGALHFPDDESGDAHRFCRALADAFTAAGGRLRAGIAAERIAVRDGQVAGVHTSDGLMECRRVVVTAGNGATRLLDPLGLSLPIRPAKGYSVTMDAPAEVSQRPRIAVVDDAMHAAVTPLGARLRVVGTAEFAGHDLRLRQERIDNLMELFAGLYPHIAAGVDRASVQPWAGLRPMSADGMPFIGATPVDGLYVSAGHGHLGWTLAAGSARLLADLMLEQTPAFDPSPFSALRLDGRTGGCAWANP